MHGGGGGGRAPALPPPSGGSRGCPAVSMHAPPPPPCHPPTGIEDHRLPAADQQAPPPSVVHAALPDKGAGVHLHSVSSGGGQAGRQAGGVWGHGGEPSCAAHAAPQPSVHGIRRCKLKPKPACAILPPPACLQEDEGHPASRLPQLQPHGKAEGQDGAQAGSGAGRQGDRQERRWAEATAWVQGCRQCSSLED